MSTETFGQWRRRVEKEYGLPITIQSMDKNGKTIAARAVVNDEVVSKWSVDALAKEGGE